MQRKMNLLHNLLRDPMASLRHPKILTSIMLTRRFAFVHRTKFPRLVCSGFGGPASPRRWAAHDGYARGSIGFIIAVAVILGGVGYLLFGKLEKNIVYFVTPTELLAKGDVAFNKPARLGGMVKKGTIEWDAKAVSLKFILTDGSKEILVSGRETPPQMFQEGMGVVVEGRLLKEGLFQSDRLMVKHSNEYHPPKEGEKPAIIYKELVR